MWPRVIQVGVVCWAISILLGGEAHAQSYTVVGLEQQQDLCAIDINNQFQVLAMKVGPTTPRTDIVIWDRAGRHDTSIDGGVYGPRPNELRFNDAGEIAGIVYDQVFDAGGKILNIVNPRLFAWAGGRTTAFPPSTNPRSRPSSVLEFTNDGTVLYSNASILGDSWVFHIPSSQLFDVRAQTGAFIADINESGLIGGYTPGRAYLRFPDGRVVVPWPEVTQVARVGPSGHFAGGYEALNGPAVFLYGRPDGSVTRIALGGEGAVRVFDINRRGHVLGMVSPLFGLQRSFLYADGTVIQLPGSPIALNDAGYMVGDYGCSRVELLIPRVTAPADVTFRMAGRTVTLDWQETYGAIDYVLEAGSVTGAADIFVGSIGQRTTFTASVPPGRYFVRLRARNDAGTGPASAEIVIDVP